MNTVLYVLDDWYSRRYGQSRVGYFLIIAGFMIAAVILTGVAGLLPEPGTWLEAVLGGSAGIVAFVGARGLIMHSYRMERPDADYRPPLRERWGQGRNKTIFAIAGGWVIGLIVLGAEEVRTPALGALTVLAVLTLITLATRTEEEKYAAAEEEIYWSSDEAAETDEEHLGSDDYLSGDEAYGDEDDYDPYYDGETPASFDGDSDTHQGQR